MKKLNSKPKVSLGDLGATVDPTAPKKLRKGPYRRRERLSAEERERKIKEMLEWANNR